MASRSIPSTKPSTISRIGHFLIVHVPPAVTAVVVGLVIVWALDRRPPMILSSPVVSGEPVVPGQQAGIEWTQNWTRLCRGTVTRKFVTAEGEVKTFAAFHIEPPAEVGTIERHTRVSIPHTLPPGSNVTMQSSVAFVCNPLQEYWPIIVAAPPVTISTAAMPKS